MTTMMIGGDNEKCEEDDYDYDDDDDDDGY